MEGKFQVGDRRAQRITKRIDAGILMPADAVCVDQAQHARLLVILHFADGGGRVSLAVQCAQYPEVFLDVEAATLGLALRAQRVKNRPPVFRHIRRIFQPGFVQRFDKSGVAAIQVRRLVKLFQGGTHVIPLLFADYGLCCGKIGCLGAGLSSVGNYNDLNGM